MTPSLEALDYLRSPGTIRSHCHQLLQLARNDGLAHFVYREEQLEYVCQYVDAEIMANYPRGNIPYHSRFRHFEAGGQDRLQALRHELAGSEPKAWGQSLFELVFISVLLDAGAGPQWSYREPESAKGGEATFARSEGLAVASFHMFCQGLFSSDPAFPWQVDARALLALKRADLAQALQLTPANPLVGLDGRLKLLQQLGANLQRLGHARLGLSFQRLWDAGQGQTLAAGEILSYLLKNFSEIWPAGLSWLGVNLGDVGRHSLVKGRLGTDGLVPFHKLSQWLTYSLLEAFEQAGISLRGVEELTGLPEYRNGGLFFDLGLLTPRDPHFAQKVYKPSDEAIVEWRALTVALLDVLAENIQKRRAQTACELPLAKILQGGTWSAGRKVAKSLRAHGGPPFTIESDGTVF